MNPSPAPEGILDPQQPYWPADKVSERTWWNFRAKLTGKKYPELQGVAYTTYVSVTDGDVDKIIANLKKWGKYPQVNQNDKYGGALNLKAYYNWLVEEFLEKPFREQTDKKIEEAAIQSRLKEIQATRDEVKKVETKEEVVVVIEDKVEVLESILQDISPPRSEYQVEDPWEGSYETPKAKPQATVKKTTKKKGRPKGSKNKTSKKKKTAPAAGPTPPGDPPRRWRSTTKEIFCV